MGRVGCSSGGHLKGWFVIGSEELQTDEFGKRHLRNAAVRHPGVCLHLTQNSTLHQAPEVILKQRLAPQTS